MYSFIRYAMLLGILGLAAGCSSTKELEKYVLVVFDTNGNPVEGAIVTPQAKGINFESKETGPDGQVNLRGLYSEMPTMIQIRAIRYKPVSVKWKLPSPSAQTVVLEAL